MCMCMGVSQADILEPFPCCFHKGKGKNADGWTERKSKTILPQCILIDLTSISFSFSSSSSFSSIACISHMSQSHRLSYFFVGFSFLFVLFLCFLFIHLFLCPTLLLHFPCKYQFFKISPYYFCLPITCPSSLQILL